MAVPHLFEVIQRKVIKLFSEQAVRFNYLLFVPNSGNVYQQQPESGNNDRSRSSPLYSCLQNLEKATFAKTGFSFHSNYCLMELAESPDLYFSFLLANS